MVLFKRLLILGCALGVAYGGLGQPSSAYATAAPYGSVLEGGAQWAGPYASLGDLGVYSNGDGNSDRWGRYGLSYECVELAVRWASVRYGVPPFSWRVSYAYQMWAAAPNLPIPFGQYPNGGVSAPQFGDILVFDHTSFNPSGHVAVVSGVGPGYVAIVEQNWANYAPTGVARLPITGTSMPARYGLPIIGWLRPSSVPFVAHVYQDTLGRSADPGGLVSWTAAVDHGLGRADTASAIMNSPEYYNHVVSGLYTSYLHRSPDLGGGAYFAARLAQGMTDATASTVMLSSDEYYGNRGGGTNAGFLTALYTDVLGRAPDPDGQAAWLGVMAGGMPRGRVAAAFLAGPEGASALVAGIYSRVLRRGPDPGGMAWWSAALERGMRQERLVANIMGSDEYQAYADTH